MNLEVKKEVETPLLSRKRVTIMATYEGATPSRKELTTQIAKKLSSDENLVILKHIYTRFGMQKAKIIAHIYQNEKDLKTYEDLSMLAKHGRAEKVKKEAKKQEENKAE